MILRTPDGIIMLLVILVPTIRLGLSGCRLSFRNLDTKWCPKNVLRLETKYFMGAYGIYFFIIGFDSYSAISYI